MCTLPFNFQSENDLYSFWEKNIATEYKHGLYLKTATERSKRYCFNRWKKDLHNHLES